MLMSLVEYLGVFPGVISAIHMPLLEKAKVGLRGIGVLPAFARYWMRVRRWEARQWEKANPRHYLAAVAGSSVVDTIWRYGCRTEVGVTMGEHCVVWGWDLKEYFEYLDRDLLRARAESLGYSAALLEPCLQLYGSPGSSRWVDALSVWGVPGEALFQAAALPRWKSRSTRYPH